ncbi:MAG: class I SAM-dependent methyltransferase [Acidobacteria bacterium]|nr:class I SAM-dependent methyltransferase [Acidobacteriota bacterium]
MQTAVALRTDKLPQTIAARTQRVYDHLAAVYPASTFLFHSKAHKQALEMSGLRNGMSVLEIATGSGEMFRRIIKANSIGYTCGVDLSPNMAARTQRVARRKFPAANLDCQAVDARVLPFRCDAFDAVFCCYLFELLGGADIESTLEEIHRVMKPRATFTMVLIGQHTRLFNKAYHVAGSLVPAFWGRQVATKFPELVKRANFRIVEDIQLRQGFYPSRILTARKD